MTDDQAEMIDDIVGDAIMWFDTLTENDADVAVDTLLDRVIAVLRGDERMPRLSREQWDLLFADAAARSKAELGELIEGKGDVVEAADAIANALTEKIANRRRRKQQAEA